MIISHVIVGDYSIIKEKIISHYIQSGCIRNNMFYVESGELYRKFCKEKNVILYENFSNKISNLIRIIDASNCVVLHNNYLSFLDLLLLSKKKLKKVVWVTWGHDLYLFDNVYNRNIFSKIKFLVSSKILFKIRNKLLSKFAGIAIGFEYDALEVRKRFKNMKIYSLLYSYNDLDLINKCKTKRNNKIKRILIGHSSFPFLNHISIMKKLLSYDSNKFVVCLPLNYGIDNAYCKKVKDFAVNNFKNVEIIDKPLSFGDYVDFLSNIDICIFDFQHQAALGNVFMLLKFNAKFFLNDNSILATAFQMENISYTSVNEIGLISFKDFINNENNVERAVSFADFYLSPKTAIDKIISFNNALIKDFNKE